jgi:hypothetical protein
VVFKYQELTKKFLKLFSIFINFNWEYFSLQYTFWKTLLASRIGELC